MPRMRYLPILTKYDMRAASAICSLKSGCLIIKHWFPEQHLKINSGTATSENFGTNAYCQSYWQNGPENNQYYYEHWKDDGKM